MDQHERLLNSDLSWDRKQFIMNAGQPATNLLLHGLPTKVVRRIFDASDPCALNGTPRSRNIADLRAHHRTRKNRTSRYLFGDRTSAAREASKVLHERRSKLAAASTTRLVPLPGCTKGKQNTAVRGPRKTTQIGSSRLSEEIDVNDIGADSLEWFEEMQDFYYGLDNFGGDDTSSIDFDDNTYINRSMNEEIEPEVEVPASLMPEPDEYDIEMAKAMEDERLNELFEEQAEQADPALEDSDMPLCNPINTEGAERQSKRKRESDFSPDAPTVVRPGQAEHNEKRRKLDTGANSSQVSSPPLRKKAEYKRGGKLNRHDLFCRSSSLAAVFEAAIAIGALGTPQVESSNASELDALDHELLGEEPSSFPQMPSSIHEDSEALIAGNLWPVVSHDDLRVANAGGKLLDIHLGNSNVSELNAADRQALKKAFGKSAQLQPSENAEGPSGFSAIPRTARVSDLSTIHRSLIPANGHTVKRYQKPIGPSREFRSFFATRRLRKNLLRQGEASWSDDDASFVVSGKNMEEPAAKFGAEFIAKSLLDGQNSPLRKIVRDSQMSNRRRQKRGSQNHNAKALSARDQRRIAQIQKSGLSVKTAKPKAKVKKSVSKAKGKKLSLEALLHESAPELNAPFMVGSLMSEVEEELAKWEREEEL